MSAVPSRVLLARLGAGQPVSDVCEAAGLTRSQFDDWWRAECRRRVPPAEGELRVRGPRGPVRVGRDAWGVPHVEAGLDADLFFGWGYATAADRLFQMEFIRRRGRGRLAELLGPAWVESDRLFRTLDLAAVADAELATLPGDVAERLAAFVAGVNALIESSDLLPVEFDLLGDRPAPWTAADSLVVLGDFRWYLTGRFPVICSPELAKRALGGDGPLYRAFLRGEADDESIVPPGAYPAKPGGVEPLPSGAGGDGPGSNNWVLAGRRTTTGKPVVASDPHIPFQAVSIWHEVVLRGDATKAAGIALAGVPGVMIGRNERVAWGVTNNICSLRDLYQERTDPAHPGCFLFDGRWEPARERVETIAVKGGEPVTFTVRSSRNGPVVDAVLPPAARHTGPVTLRWGGHLPCGWLTSLLRGQVARTADEFRNALEPWRVPTFNLVFADADGHIGHQTTGRLPLRAVAERGYRPGWEPKHQWAGFIPFEGLPRQADPARGFVVTANNRLAADDFPYPLSSTASGGHRARVIRTEIEARPTMSADDCKQLQMNTLTLRGVECVPPLLALLEGDTDPRVREAVGHLRAWDCRSEPDRVGATLFHVFFARWCRVACAERFPADQVELVAGFVGGLATSLLHADDVGWFHKSDRREAVLGAFRAALDEITGRLGPDMDAWTWGRLHTLQQKHFLSGRGDLGALLDCCGHPVHGDGTTVHSSTSDAAHGAYLGAGYRMVADLADARQRIWAVESGSTSGHPGSPHYDDQIAPWFAGEFHELALAGPAEYNAVRTLRPE
jgi:penicillin amidase